MALQPIEGQPGLFREVDESGNPVGPVINIRDFREGDKYDSIAIDTGNIVAGTEFLFFQDVQQKRLLDTNLKTPSKLSAGESMVLDRIGLYMRTGVGIAFPPPQDFKTVYDGAYFKLEINGILQDEGPAIKFPSGYGLYGMTNESGQGIVSLGVPATASAARMVKKQLLNQNHELLGTLRFDTRPWLTSGSSGFWSATGIIPAITVQTTADEDAGVVVMCLLHGLIRAAVTK